ncbi:selenide, water dikinase SelD, partial [Virgibacillus halodenitrificans]|nr:selenide, water dikinase SelD [Virgibacillus halodenitrificans]
DQWILCDAVTSGGLLIAVSSKEADQLFTELREKGVEAQIIGEVKDSSSGHINVR